ncbi:MAG: hypothetical protein DME61_08260 [Verrucomicrobia bacterium]|nr:MAG: hypothetical protein DME61_08260 [Verrucomicrobiota bacterium]
MGERRLRRRRGERQSNPFHNFGRTRPGRAGLVVLLLISTATALAAPLIPTTDGTGWRYNMTEEVGKGLNIPDAKPDADGKIRLPVLYRIGGTENVDGKDLLKFEMHRAGVITNTDLLTVDEHGIFCRARINLDGELVKFDPPQTMIATPLKKGASWDFNGQAGELKVNQHYYVVDEEDIKVPAGKFHAFRIHGEQASPSPMTIDRWFASGIGIVKDVTIMRAANGDLLQRISLELVERPKITERPEVKSDAAPKQLSVSLARDWFGEPMTTFSSNTPAIYARWQGQRLREGAKVKAMWIAENIGEDFPQDHKVDEASAVAESPTAHGAFTLARPEDGWAPGDYRVEFYVDDVLVDAVKLKIAK